jgi:ATP-dependent exoDNAse (exonuclease V) alpha subunit
LTTTHIVVYRRHAEGLNDTITSTLPSPGMKNSIATDYINEQELLPGEANKSFKRLTNLPDWLQIAVGARVMFLNNTLFNSGVCNESMGVILTINADDSIKVAFPTANGIQEVDVYKTALYFYLNCAHVVRRLYPLANAFALTVYKTQGLTLPYPGFA